MWVSIFLCTSPFHCLKKNWNAKKYSVYLDAEKIGEYTRKELEDIFSINNRTPNRVINGKRDTIGGYVAFKENVCQNNIESRLSKIRQKPRVMGKYCKVEITK